MLPIHRSFTDMLMTKRLQTLQSVDSGIEQVVNKLKETGKNIEKKEFLCFLINSNLKVNWTTPTSSTLLTMVITWDSLVLLKGKLSHLILTQRFRLLCEVLAFHPDLFGHSLWSILTWRQHSLTLRVWRNLHTWMEEAFCQL